MQIQIIITHNFDPIFFEREVEVEEMRQVNSTELVNLLHLAGLTLALERW